MKGAPGDQLAPADKFTGLLIFAFAVVTGFGSGGYRAHGIEISGPFRVLTYFGFLIVMTFWLQKDSRRSEAWRVWDFGFFMCLIWPLFVPYYLFKTRGAKGILPVIGLVGSYVIAFILGFLVVKK